MVSFVETSLFRKEDMCMYIFFFIIYPSTILQTKILKISYFMQNYIKVDFSFLFLLPSLSRYRALVTVYDFVLSVEPMAM